jgi:hypothetical protein
MNFMAGSNLPARGSVEEVLKTRSRRDRVIQRLYMDYSNPELGWTVEIKHGPTIHSGPQTGPGIPYLRFS